MRILNLIPTLGTGGAERQLAYLAVELASRGNDLHVAHVRDGTNRARLEAGGVGIHRLPASGNHDPLLFFGLVRLIRRLRPEIVQTWLLQMDLLGGAAALLCGTPWVLTERSSIDGYPGGAKNRLRRTLGSRADALVANSAGGEEYWRRAPAPRTRVVIPNAVPLAEIDSAGSTASPAGLDPACGRRFILCVGRLSGEKNLSNLLRGVAGPLRESGAALLVCGDGPLRAGLASEAAGLGISGDVILAGDVPGVWELMRRAVGLVSVSRFEGSPNVVLEAMACGCPLVVSDIRAHREFLDESAALFARPENPESIGSAVRRMLADPPGARLRADEARRRIGERSVSAMADRYLSVYGPLLSEGRAGR